MLYDACCNLLIEEVARAAQDDITREAARAGLFFTVGAPAPEGLR